MVAGGSYPTPASLLQMATYLAVEQQRDYRLSESPKASVARMKAEVCLTSVQIASCISTAASISDGMLERVRHGVV